MSEWKSKLEPYWFTAKRAKIFKRIQRASLVKSSNFYKTMREDLRTSMELDIDENSFRMKFEQEFSKDDVICNRVIEKMTLDLDRITEKIHTDSVQPKKILTEYEEQIPYDFWPRAIAKVDELGSLEKVAHNIQKKGYVLATNDFFAPGEPLEKFKLFHMIEFHFPPDVDFLKPVTSVKHVEMIYDAEKEVALPRPVESKEDVYLDLTESRKMLFPAKEKLPSNFTVPYGRNVVICIIDTGIDEKHPDLSGRIVETANFTDDESPTDENGHGTHCAGISGGDGAASDGRFIGIAPGVDFINAKVLNKKGLGTTVSVLSGIRFGIEKKADILSLSLGSQGTTDGQSILSSACNRAFELGCFVCVSAGNSGPDPGTISIPGDAEKAFTVGAVDKRKRLALFTSRGPTSEPISTGCKPNLLAPGVRIVSARSQTCIYPPYQGNPHYTALSGTSMSCPHIAGAVAAMLSYAKGLGSGNIKPDLIKSIIIDHCEKITGEEETAQGAGFPNITDAVLDLRDKLMEKDGRNSDTGWHFNFKNIFATWEARLIWLLFFIFVLPAHQVASGLILKAGFDYPNFFTKYNVETILPLIICMSIITVGICFYKSSDKRIKRTGSVSMVMNIATYTALTIFMAGLLAIAIGKGTSFQHLSRSLYARSSFLTSSHGYILSAFPYAVVPDWSLSAARSKPLDKIIRESKNGAVWFYPLDIYSKDGLPLLYDPFSLIATESPGILVKIDKQKCNVPKQSLQTPVAGSIVRTNRVIQLSVFEKIDIPVVVKRNKSEKKVVKTVNPKTFINKIKSTPEGSLLSPKAKRYAPVLIEHYLDKKLVGNYKDRLQIVPVSVKRIEHIGKIFTQKPGPGEVLSDRQPIIIGVGRFMPDEGDIELLDLLNNYVYSEITAPEMRNRILRYRLQGKVQETVRNKLFTFPIKKQRFWTEYSANLVVVADFIPLFGINVMVEDENTSLDKESAFESGRNLLCKNIWHQFKKNLEQQVFVKSNDKSNDKNKIDEMSLLIGEGEILLMETQKMMDVLWHIINETGGNP
jgi:hypothetical protein